MRDVRLVILPLVFAAGCAASTYPLNAQLAREVGLPGTRAAFLEQVGSGTGLAFLQHGDCSWYGPGFHGNRTSSGEVFNTHALTAAHPTLPFGSEVEVTDTSSGRSVRVRINDRGPFSSKRVLDLSYAAAQDLGIVGKGVASVEIKLVGIDAADWPDEVWSVQVGRFATRAEADRFLAGIPGHQRSAGLLYIKGPDRADRTYRVRFGPFEAPEGARTLASRLQRSGLKPSLVQEKVAPGAQASAAPSRVLR